MRKQNHKDELKSTAIILNCSYWDITNKLATKNYSKLKTVTEFTINYIITNCKKFNYLLNKKLELSLVITNNAGIKEINYEWQKILAATNVLSMALFNKRDAKLSPLILLGDVIISLETAKKEAIAYNIPLESHLIRLLVHGILHIFGFDHKTNKTAETMYALENTILQVFTKDIPGLTSSYWN